MKIKELIQAIQKHAPSAIQESYDNSGLATGDPELDVEQMLVCLDVTEDVLDEAIKKGCHLIVSHHPLLFGGLKRIDQNDSVGRILIQAIRHNIAIYSAHTNLDKVLPGVSSVLADQLALIDQEILVPDPDSLLKLITFIPATALEAVSQAVFSAGAGRIGNYDSCSYQIPGEGTFRALDGAQPFVGQSGQFHRQPEVRLETIVPAHLQQRVVSALLKTHPYEEPAYDLVPLLNRNRHQGLGMVGYLKEDMSPEKFLQFLKTSLALETIRYTKPIGTKIRKVALCGGSGSEFLPQAKASGAQVYLSGDFKYHQFFEAAGEIMIADIGHYESEVFAKELIKQIVRKKFPTFAVHLSNVITNPIKYF